MDQRELVIEMSQHHHHTPPPLANNLMYSVYVIAIDLVIAITQLLASIIVLAVSTHEKAPLLRIWVLVNLAGHIPNISLLVYRYRTRHIAQHQPPDSHARLVQENLGFALFCFFGVWLIFGYILLIIVIDPSIANQAPNMYRLFIALMILIGTAYALPGVICVAACFCFPCFWILQALTAQSFWRPKTRK